MLMKCVAIKPCVGDRNQRDLFCEMLASGRQSPRSGRQPQDVKKVNQGRGAGDSTVTEPGALATGCESLIEVKARPVFYLIELVHPLATARGSLTLSRVSQALL